MTGHQPDRGLIEIQLTAVFGEMLHFSDDYTTLSKLEVEILNSANRIAVKDLGKSHRSEFAFTVHAKDFSFRVGEQYRRVQKILAMALTLLAETVIFSPARTGWLPIHLAEDLQNPNETLSNIEFKRKIIFDEKDVLDLVSKLIQLNFGSAILHGKGEALDTYSLILSSVTVETVYSHLYAAVDKAANSGRTKDLSGQALDLHVATALGINQSDIADFRNNANRLKHATDSARVQELIDARNSVIRHTVKSLEWTSKYLRLKI